MRTLLANHAFPIAIVLAALGAVAAIVVFINLVPDALQLLNPPPEDTGEGLDGPQTAALVIAGLTLVVTTIGNGFTILLGWRKERREVAESKLKIQRLELEVARMAAATNPAAE